MRYTYYIVNHMWRTTGKRISLFFYQETADFIMCFLSSFFSGRRQTLKI